jgi:hypothetical protein
VARYRILYWGEIPASVKIFSDEGQPKSVALDGWFAQEIDRVAMREGLVGSDAYLDQFRWSDDLERPGSAEDAAVEVVAELAAQWIPEKREPGADQP